MDLVNLFVSFTNALGFEPFFFLINVYFLILLLPKADKPLPFTVLVLVFGSILLAKKGIADFFFKWPFELTVLTIAFYVFVKNIEKNSSYLWILLGAFAFALVT